jgi:hypothetical protein
MVAGDGTSRKSREISESVGHRRAWRHYSDELWPLSSRKLEDVPFGEVRHDTHGFCASNGFAHPALGLCGETSLSASEDFAHVCDILGEEKRVCGVVYGVHAKCVERIGCHCIFASRADDGLGTGLGVLLLACFVGEFYREDELQVVRRRNE